MTGNVTKLAKAIAQGAEASGATIRLRRVTELMPHEAIEKRLEIRTAQEEIKNILIATQEDLQWADGIAFGSPTRYGNMCAQLKEFLDQTGQLWLSGALEGKVACVFTSTATQHGGQESTLLSMMVPLFHLGFVVLGLPYSERSQMSVGMIHGGSPYGVSSISGPNGVLKPTAEDIEMARALGRRLALTAKKLSAPKANDAQDILHSAVA